MEKKYRVGTWAHETVLDRLWLGLYTWPDFPKCPVSLADHGVTLGPWGSEWIQSQHLLTSARSRISLSLVHSYPVNGCRSFREDTQYLWPHCRTRPQLRTSESGNWLHWVWELGKRPRTPPPVSTQKLWIFLMCLASSTFVGCPTISFLEIFATVSCRSKHPTVLLFLWLIVGLPHLRLFYSGIPYSHWDHGTQFLCIILNCLLQSIDDSHHKLFKHFLLPREGVGGCPLGLPEGFG